ncbi:Thiamin biosynthesis lipoprotein ApbE [Mucinivorans hirudinis]|uniref:FAD:protein FMN transferase n=1 Tax=Mucinivorans hirudinis TaxID=1433126 RepID=A0A060RCR6_9BACT|nr:Thiamin biosynthesis lipoprotein ApbE [Mucinivorans hirudinis]
MKKLLIFSLLALLACAKKESPSRYVTIDGFAEGTTYHIVYRDSVERDLQPDITDFFERFENSLSIYNPASLISQINEGEDVELDDWFLECFNISTQINGATHGLFEPTLRPLIAAYGFGGKGAARVVTQEQIDSALALVGLAKVRIEHRRIVRDDERIELDFNAIAKGYSVDLLGELLEEKGIRDYLVEVGGEIVCRGKNANGGDWTVSIDSPKEGNYSPGADTQAIISFTNKGLATSGNYRKFAVDDAGNKVVHTIDPRTGKSAQSNLLSATIIAPTCAIADGYATACMVAGLEGAKQMIESDATLEALFIYAEGELMKVYATQGMMPMIRQTK